MVIVPSAIAMVAMTVFPVAYLRAWKAEDSERMKKANTADRKVAMIDKGFGMTRLGECVRK